MRRRKKLYAKRMIIGLFFTLFEIDERLHLSEKMESLAGRRQSSMLVHYVGGSGVHEKVSTRYRRGRTPWVFAAAILGMTAVLINALLLIPHNPRMFLSIPIYGIYMTVLMVLRARDLAKEKPPKYKFYM
jgi:hypothetical protein